MPVVNGNNITYYDHPFNVTVINDNSIIPTTVTAVPERVNYLCVFAGGKGRDNKLLKMTSKNEFIREFGKPDALKYGQPILNAYASIVDLYSHAFCMRVMPADAGYANLIVMAKYKVSDDGANLEIKYETKSVGNLNNMEHFQATMEKNQNLEPDEGGFKTVPLFAIRSLGRGKYGNSYRIRLSNVFTKKKIDYRFYRLEILDVDEGNKVVESFEGCLYDQAINSVSYILTDVLDGETNGSSRLNMIVNDNAMELIYEDYKGLFAKGEVVPTMKEFDPVFGMGKDKVAHDKLVILDGVELDRLDGIALLGGHDGSFDNLPEGKTLEEVVDELYLKAFAGELDKAILSTRRTPVKFILDANYSMAVKREMVQLGLKRYDALVYLDAGLITTNDEAILFGEETSDLNYRIVSKSYQHYEIRDPFSGKRVPVTMTYDLACNLAKHIETHGLAKAYTGETYATLRGAIKNSLVPILDETDEELKEKLYDLRLNYYEAITDTIHARGTQVTAQDVNSDLSEETNMLMLLEIKDIAEKESLSKRYNFAEPSDRALFTEMLKEKVKKLKDSVRNIDVLFNMTPWEEQRSILHCYIEVTFKTIVKSSIVEININSRV